MNAREKVSKIMQGEMTAQENVLQFLDKIKAENEKYNIFLHMNEKALEEAKAVDAKVASGKPVGKLAGLAFAIKSNICVEGIITNCASKVLENYTATYDADVVKRIRAEDGIIIGMVNMDEFACGAFGITSAFGKTNNPAADGYVTGGSSSGSAAAVAADFCDIALGSDTGGSIRAPSSHCGVFGLKPSYGRVSRFGLIDMAMSFDQIGPIGKCVDDLKLIMEVIAGFSENDASTSEKPAEFGRTKDIDLQKLRIGVSSDFEKLCTDKRIYEKVLAKLSELSLSTTNVSLPNINLAVQTYYPIVYVEMFSGTRKFDGRRYGYKIEDKCGDEVLRRILGGKEISKAEHAGKYYRSALAVKEEITKSMAQAFEEVDIMVLPVTPVLPHKFEEEMDVKASYAVDAYTIPANLSGICAGVVPLGEIDGIPVGMQIFAPAFSEDKLLGIMEQFSK